MIDLLTRPEKHGGTSSDAFHVVVPSMPGFAFSESPDELAGYAAASIADRWQQLMKSLGYERFLASGTDIGARVTAWLAVRHPASLLGAHMSTNAVSWSRDPSRSYDRAATAWIEEMEEWEATEGGYHHLQGTKPSTVAIAVSDSPAAMAAWVVEKWQAWSESPDMAAPAARTVDFPLPRASSAARPTAERHGDAHAAVVLLQCGGHRWSATEEHHRSAIRRAQMDGVSARRSLHGN